MIVATRQAPVARSQLTSGVRLRPLLPFFPTMVGACQKNCFPSFDNDHIWRGGSPASRGICGDTTDPRGGFRAPYAIGNGPEFQ